MTPDERLTLRMVFLEPAKNNSENTNLAVIVFAILIEMSHVPSSMGHTS